MEPIRDWSLTEDPTLYGLVTRNQGDLVEFISYQEASRRMALVTTRGVSPSTDDASGERRRNVKGTWI